MSKSVEEQLRIAVNAGINMTERISSLKEVEKAQDCLIEALKIQNKELEIENKELKLKLKESENEL